MRVFDHIREGLHRRLGVDEAPAAVSADEWRGSEWSHEFERLCRARMFCGGLRYGRLGAPGKPQWDRVEDILRRVAMYRETGNLELLVDAANLCQCEYVEGDHPLRHFEAADDGAHTRRKGEQ